MALIEAKNISKTYTDMARPVEVLRDLNFDVEAGQAVGIFGASGTGKSTLLHILGGLDEPTRGSVFSEGADIGRLDDEGLAHFRNCRIGFVFQFYHLLGEFTALENAMLPPLIAGKSKGEARRMAQEALEAMGLGQRLNHRPAALSGGEQQRVALARASVMKPKAILADEPTGNLDRATGEIVWQYLLNLNRQQDIALVIVTHNRDLLSNIPIVYELKDGRLHSK